MHTYKSGSENSYVGMIHAHASARQANDFRFSCKEAKNGRL